MADSTLVVEKKTGHPKKEADYNNVCRVCKVSLIVAYGATATKTCFKFSKPSQTQESFGDVLAGRLRNVAGFKIVDSLGSPQLVCKGCHRKINNLS